MSRVAVIGTGYVGLTTGACLAHLGHDVVCADIDAAKVETLQAGRIPIFEAGLEALVGEGIGAGRLRFVVGALAAVPAAEFVFLCVQTPQGADGSADLRFIEQASAEIGPALANEAVVITKSTVPVGSARVVEQALGRPEIAVVSNPEFLREGQAVHDCLHPDRVVIGSDDQAAAAKVAGLYRGLNAPVMVTDPTTAETIKYACNAFLATKVSFINAIANLCQAVGADVRDVVLGMGYDKRIGFEFLKPGPGWGGSCFPKDSRALVRIAEDAGYNFELLKGVIAVNDQQFQLLADRIMGLAGKPEGKGKPEGQKVVAVWGLTFKAGTDDLRNSPAISVIERLLASGAVVRAFDPTVNGALPAHFRHLEVAVCRDPYAACEGAAVLAVLTEWDEFRWLDFQKVAGLMASPAIFDARNLLDPMSLRRRGFTYEGLGRR